MQTLLLLLGTVLHSVQALKHPHIVVYIADDLGYADLFTSATHTPFIDDLFKKSVQLTDYYQWRLCSPSR